MGRGSRGCVGLCGEGRQRCGARRGVGGGCTEEGRVGEVVMTGEITKGEGVDYQVHKCLGETIHKYQAINASWDSHVTLNRCCIGISLSYACDWPQEYNRNSATVSACDSSTVV